MKSIIEQKPATKNQIENAKPDIIKNSNILQGMIANSFNGGHYKTIAFAPIMAGQKVSEHRLRINLKELTPKTPAFQQLKGHIQTFFVPNSRVWKNWEKFEAQKGGSTVEKIKEVPNLGGYGIPQYLINDKIIPLTDTDMWRDSWVSSYIPRYQSRNERATIAFPKYDILPLRGFIAIYNDFLRNKEYEEEWQEYNSDTMSQSEYNTYFDMERKINVTKHLIRARRQNSYYTDYRTELLGLDDEYSLTETPTMLSSLVEYQKLVAEARQEALDAQLNDWDIIAKQRGSRILTEGKVQLLGTNTFPINYETVTQSAYNINENIEENFQVLGEQGAYSYTEIDLPLYQMQEFKESGYIHVIINVTADTVFETAFDRQLLNVDIMDRYRPEFKELKDDVLLELEMNGSTFSGEDDVLEIVGYKRKFSEYFKLPNLINGDLMTDGFYKTKYDFEGEDPLEKLTIETSDGEPIEILSKKSFQFFEKDNRKTIYGNTKNIWQDYTDLLLNKNMAIEQEVEQSPTIYANPDDVEPLVKGYSRVKGDNQFFLMGIQTMVADLPIDENIKKNYSTWGEE